MSAVSPHLGVLGRRVGSAEPWRVSLVVGPIGLLSVRMYANAAGTIPTIQALIGKGAALAFMMSVIALSLPEMVILREVLRPRLIAAFVGVVAVGIVAIGFLFNSILTWLGLP